MTKKISIVGIGPGAIDMMTVKAQNTVVEADVVAGYNYYVDLVMPLVDEEDQIIIKNGMTKEKERCMQAIEKASEGNKVAMVCSGDAGLYGMAGLVYELIAHHKFTGIEVEVVPGVTAAVSSSSLLGAAIVEDFCTISLSDYMTPFEKIFKRVEFATKADFVMAIYNPRSKARQDYLEKAVNIMLEDRDASTPVGIVKNAYRDEEEVIVTTLGEIDYTLVDMFSTVVIGNSKSQIIDGKIVTSRGYTL